MGLFSKIIAKKAGGIIDKGLDIAKEAVVDKDAYYKLEHGLNQMRTELLLSGSGASITKITICGLVTLVVGIGSYVFLKTPEAMESFKDYALAVTPMIGMLIGVYGSGRAFKNSKWSK